MVYFIATLYIHPHPERNCSLSAKGDRMDPLHGAIEFRPRGRSLAMGGIPWLPRITDKARAMLRGNLGDYIYP